MDSVKKLVVCAVLVARAAAADNGNGSGADAEVHASWFDKRVSAISVAGVYGVVGTYAWLAWFHGAHTQPFSWETPDWAHEQPFALREYAGGADKWGHAWANYVMVRGTTELLAAGGWRRWPSSLVAAGIAETLFAMQETKDGYIWGFEVGDMAMDVAGAALGVAMENLPAVDRVLDFRMSWWPSPDFRKLWRAHPWSRGDGIDFTQDYSGMTFQLAVHLAPLASEGEALWWTQWVDVVGGFEARGYSPPPMPRVYDPYQDYYLGLGVNVQGIVDRFATGKVRRVGHGLTEVWALPGQTLRFGEGRRVWTNPQ